MTTKLKLAAEKAIREACKGGEMTTQPNELPPALWCTEPSECLDCGHKWVAVYPLGAAILECPKCNSTDTVRGEDDE